MALFLFSHGKDIDKCLRKKFYTKDKEAIINTKHIGDNSGTGGISSISDILDSNNEQYQHIQTDIRPENRMDSSIISPSDLSRIRSNGSND